MRPIIHAVYFSCGAHAAYLEYSLRSLAQVNESRIAAVHIGEDPDDPLTPDVRARLAVSGLPLRFGQWGKVTGYGEDTIVSELRAFCEIAGTVETGDWLMKVDSDVLFLNGDLFDQMAHCHGEMVGQRERAWGSAYQYAQGGVYFLRAGSEFLQQQVTKEYIHQIATQTEGRFSVIAQDYGKKMMAQCPEDAVMDALVRASGGAVELKDYYLPLWQLDRLIKKGRGYALRKPSLSGLMRNPRVSVGVLWHDWKLRLGRYSVIHFQYCKERMSEIYEIIASS